MKNLAPVQRVMLGLLVGIIAVPMTSTALFLSKPATNAVSSSVTDELTTQDRALLRRYTRAGFCPDTLQNFRISGFYDLCVSIVGLTVKSDPVRGFLNHNAYIQQALRPAASTLSPFKLRMQMMDQAIHGTRRDGGTIPGRPTNCSANPDC